MSGFGRWNPAPQLWSWFKKMQERAKYLGTPCAFSNDLVGYQQFVDEIGSIPAGMQHPTVGRIDHNKGYVQGNFRWQERSDNSSEVCGRIGLNKLGGLACKVSPRANFKQIATCPHCAKSGHAVAMHRWHFDNCRQAA